jgi:hypothetical protein
MMMSARHLNIAIASLVVIAPSVATEDAPTAAAAIHYKFDITKGRGTSVCESYLKRLNQTDFRSDPPYCDRPEGDLAPGFAPVRRVPVTQSEYKHLFPLVWSFMRPGDSLPLDPSALAEDNSPVLGVWRSEEPIDISNDGQRKYILMWRGLGASNFSAPCGSIGVFGLPDTADRSVGLRLPQLAYVLDANRKVINRQETRKVFGHPSGGYRYTDSDGRVVLETVFRPVGLSIGIFEYKGKVYFDTFFDSWGDFENQRQDAEEISNTLGVFIHEANRTRQVCEFHMEGNDYDNSFFQRLPP